MPRPQKYTDSDIAAAIQILEAEGGDVNPMRVRMRLGGGNVRRIKAILAERRREPLGPDGQADLPEALLNEVQRLFSETSQQVTALVGRCWEAGLAASQTRTSREGARLRHEIATLEGRLATSADLVARLERQRDEQVQALDATAVENEKLVQTCDGLRSALRNAESDVRAAQRVIDNLERNQRDDREEIRALQNRIEGLVAEIAVIKAKSTTSKAASTRRKAG